MNFLHHVKDKAVAPLSFRYLDFVKTYFILTILSGSLSALAQSNLIGGFYSAQADASVARVGDATSTVNNPAGLGKVTKDSISSGASSFVFKKEKEGSGNFESSANHVAYVKSLNKFSLGLMIYTISSGFDFKASGKEIQNDEGLPQKYSQSSAKHQDNNYYVVSLAPKNSFWGISLIGLSYSVNESYNSFKSEFSQSSPSERSFSSNSSNLDLNLLSAAIGFGLQFKKGSFVFGARAESPFLILQNDSQISANGIAAAGFSGDDLFLTNYYLDDELENESDTLDKGRVKVGIGYIQKKWSFEFDLQYTPASETRFVPKGEVAAAVFSTQTGQYNLQNSQTESPESDSQDFLSPSIGFQYSLGPGLKLGAGALYEPSANKKGEGLDTLKLTGGFTTAFKNYLGSFALIYVDAKDAGGNTAQNIITGEDEEADLSYTQLGLIFSGAYYF